MPIPLGNQASPIVSVGDEYDPITGGPATLLPVQTVKRVQFVVATASVFAQVSREATSNVPVWDLTEIPFVPGTYILDTIKGIRFRNGVSGLISIVNAVAYLEDDPLPLAVSQTSLRLSPFGQLLGVPTQTVYSNHSPVGNPFVYNPPFGCTGIFVELWGAGAGAGGVSGGVAGKAIGTGGGGGGGYLNFYLPIPFFADVQNALISNGFLVTVGLGGAGGFGLASGAAGGDTIFQLPATIPAPWQTLGTAKGGGGTSPGAAIIPTALGTIGGGGGQPFTGAYLQALGIGWGIQGESGDGGIMTQNTSAVVEARSGKGGNSPRNGRGGPSVQLTATGSSNGNIGGFNGGGGSGAVLVGAAGTNNGGSGFDGMVAITEFYEI